MQMKPLGVKLCCLIGHMTTMGVASLYPSLSSGDHPEGIQKYLIPIYQVGNQWIELFVWSCILIPLDFKELSTPYVILWR